MLERTRQTRTNFLQLLEGLDNERLNYIPDGFNNNLAWNFGHIIVTQQLLTYGLSGLSLKVPENTISAFRKGSKPEKVFSTAEIEELRHLAVSSLDQFERDHESGLFRDFKVYETSYGLTLHSLPEAVSFNDLHEGLHLGYAMSLKRVVLAAHR